MKSHPYEIRELTILEDDGTPILIQAIVDEETGLYMEVEVLRLLFGLLMNHPQVFHDLLYLISDLLDEDEDGSLDA